MVKEIFVTKQHENTSTKSKATLLSIFLPDPSITGGVEFERNCYAKSAMWAQMSGIYNFLK